MNAAPVVATVATWRDSLDDAAFVLPRGEAVRILQECSGMRDGRWALALDEPIQPVEADRIAGMVARRVAGEPLQYVLGRWGFRSLDIEVGPEALIPRAETEVVVEVALKELRRVCEGDPALSVRVADLGTGTGAIALSIAVEAGSWLPGLEVWGTDISPDALALAGRNRDGVRFAVEVTNGAGLVPTPGSVSPSVTLTVGSWYEALPAELHGEFHLVVSNPPYLSENEIISIDTVVSAWEPHSALVAGPTGLEAIEKVVEGGVSWLCATGVLVVEIAPHQADEACLLALRAGFTSVSVERDLTGRDRVLVARR